MTLPPAALLVARYPSTAFLALAVAGLALSRRSATLAAVRDAARAKGDFDRFVIWRDAFRLARRRPALGVGPGNYPDHARRYYAAYATASAPARVWTAGIVSAHGNYPQLAVETGFAGLGAAAWVLGCAVSTSWRLFRTAKEPFLRSLAAGIGASLAGQAATGVLSDTLLPSYHNGGHVKIASTIYTWALLGGLIAIEARTAASEGVARQTSGAALGRFALAAAGGSALLGTAETLQEARAARRVCDGGSADSAATSASTRRT
jgi:O-antigen ligase